MLMTAVDALMSEHGKRRRFAYESSMHRIGVLTGATPMEALPSRGVLWQSLDGSRVPGAVPFGVGSNEGEGIAVPNDSMDQRQFAEAESMRVASASDSREAISLQEAVSRQGPSRCPACRESHIARGRYNLAVCDGCRHVFQSDLHVSMVYDADYAHQYDHRPHEAMSRIRWEFIQQHLGLPQGSKVLDIGYGNGAFLKLAQREGMDIFGIDLHGEDFGVPEVDYDTTIDFDLICFFDSIEHLPEFDLIYGLNARNVIVSIPDPPDFLLS